MDVNDSQKKQSSEICTVLLSQLEIASEVHDDFTLLLNTTSFMKVNGGISQLSNKFRFPHVYYDQESCRYKVFAEYLILAKYSNFYSVPEEINVVLHAAKPKSIGNISKEYLLTVCASNISLNDSARLLMNIDSTKVALIRKYYGKDYSSSQRQLSGLTNSSRQVFRLQPNNEG